MDDADRIVEGLAKHRQAAVFGFEETGHDVLEGGVDLDGLDVCPRRHHIADVELGELPGVLGKFVGGREIRGAGLIAFAEGAQHLAQHAAQSPMPGAPATSLGRFGRGRVLIAVGHLALFGRVGVGDAQSRE